LLGQRTPIPGAPCRRMAATVSAECRSSLQDLFGDLDRTAEAGRRAAADVRPDRGLRTGHGQDGLGPPRRPQPLKEDVQRLTKATCTRSFNRFGKQAGTDFEPPCSKRLKPKVLDPWTEERKSCPERTFAKLSSAIRLQATPEPFPEPHAGLCHRRHQEWLGQHAAARDKHIHATFHALERVKKAEEQLESHEFKRQLARDMLSRSSAVALPEFGENAMNSLSKARKTIAVTRTFNLLAGADRLAREEEADKALLARGKSSPELALRPPTPQGKVKHLRNWAGPDHPPKCFRESTPWREHDEERALRKLAEPRMR